MKTRLHWVSLCSYHKLAMDENNKEFGEVIRRVDGTWNAYLSNSNDCEGFVKNCKTLIAAQIAIIDIWEEKPEPAEIKLVINTGFTVEQLEELRQILFSHPLYVLNGRADTWTMEKVINALIASKKLLE